MAKEIKQPIDNKMIVKEESRKIREQQERQALLFRTDELLPKPSLKRELEKHQLQSGVEFTFKDIKDLVNNLAREYSPMFPNSKPFFRLMYKLHGWNNLNPNDFIKPPIVAIYIKKYIYSRFDKEILPTLLAKENPLISGYIRKYKLFQFLNDQGLLLLEGYIQDAINVMEISKDWYDFELNYTKQYKLSVQLRCITT